MPGKKKKRMPGKERSAQIVDVAAGLFAKKGFKGATTREIARAAGISEATIFKHFARKEDLYAALIDKYCTDPEGRLFLASRLEGKSGREFFKELALLIMERYRQDTTFTRLLFFSALEGHELSDMFMKSRGMESLELLSGHVGELMRNGSLKKGDPELAARAFAGMVAHYCMFQEVFGFKKFFKRRPEDVAEMFVDIFMNGMAKGRRK
ncbi:MAG: TetR/AcrR family transcriptional regulator [Thermodesulfobacteriota bacterium]